MTESPIVLFDGVCAFCNRWIRMILKADRDGDLRFAAIDSAPGAAIIARHPELSGVDSVVFVRDHNQPSESVATRTDAIVAIASYLGGVWMLAKLLVVIPRPIRDFLYNRFAAVRYRIFGKYDSCPIPAAKDRARFLD